MSSVFTYSKIHENFFKNHGKRVEYKKGYPLVWGKDDSPWVFFLEQGIIKASLAANDASETLLGYFVPGATFAQIGSLFGKQNENMSYEALSPSVVYRIETDEFMKEVQGNHEFCADYNATIAKYNQFLIDRIAYQNEKGIRLKTLKWLNFMAKYYGEQKGDGYLIYIPMTQETIAQFLHCTRESANKTLADLRTENLIESKKKLLFIPKFEQFQDLIKHS